MQRPANAEMYKHNAYLSFVLSSVFTLMRWPRYRWQQICDVVQVKRMALSPARRHSRERPLPACLRPSIMIWPLSQPASALPLFIWASFPLEALNVLWNLRTTTDLCDVAFGNTCTSARPRMAVASFGSSAEITVTGCQASGRPWALKWLQSWVRQWG
jgi:hypothetical protein